MFVSLALQLMKLVGLKTTEMAEERRFSTIVSSFDSSQPQVISVKYKSIYRFTFRFCARTRYLVIIICSNDKHIMMQTVQV